jgi:hypothetical protein
MLEDDRELRKAYHAYERGEMPITKWSKRAFVYAVERELGVVPGWVRTLPKRRMYEFLLQSGVYVTGNRIKHRHTIFYRLDVQKVASKFDCYN